MRIDVDPDWWKTIFDEIYLITDARSVGDEALTGREVDVICELLPISKSSKILDLCGGHGRHTFELSHRGFTECTVLDFSRTLIDIAAAKAKENGYSIECIRRDARETGLPSETFDHVLIMGNSLGYIQEPDADTRILTEAFRVLRSGGWLLIDVADGAAVKNAFNPSAWHEIGDDMVVCRQREIRGTTIHAREMVLHKQTGLIRDRTYAVSLYDSRGLKELLRQAGYSPIKIYTDFAPHQGEGDYGFMNRRMIGVGQKP